MKTIFEIRSGNGKTLQFAEVNAPLGDPGQHAGQAAPAMIRIEN